MKTLLVIAVAAFFVAPACSQTRKSPHDTVSTSNISVTYGRPYKKQRKIFGGLEPYGKVWRTGADQATEITFAKDGTFGGQPVKAGTYTLFTIPNEGEWTVILNGQLGQWGAFSYDKNKEKDVLQVKVPAQRVNPPIEQHTIRFDKSNLIIEWDDTRVAVPVSFK